MSEPKKSVAFRSVKVAFLHSFAKRKSTIVCRVLPKRDRGWPDYASVWRWHFYAGVFCIPFVIVLSITGTIYLPLFGLSLVIVLVLDWFVFSRIRPLAFWLGRGTTVSAATGALAMTILLAGCSGAPDPVTGGTKGTLTSGGVPLSQMQINAFNTTGEMIGRGYLASDGSFELINQDQSGPLVLPNGTYRFTIESLGAEVLTPKQYTDPATTPLSVDHQTGKLIQLSMPRMKGI